MNTGGRKGRETGIIPPSSYCINTYLFDVEIVDMTNVPENGVGIVTTLQGQPLDEGHAGGKIINAHNRYQDADAFLNGNGYKGLQVQVILSGSYFFKCLVCACGDCKND